MSSALPKVLAEPSTAGDDMGFLPKPRTPSPPLPPTRSSNSSGLNSLSLEYPSAPTLKYFLLKLLVGLIVLIVLGAELLFRPNDCSGVCALAGAGQDGMGCEQRDPSKLVFVALPGHEAAAQALVSTALAQNQLRKGFHFENAASKRSKWLPTFESYRTNRTLTYADSTVPTAESDVSYVTVLRDPRRALREAYSQRNLSLSFDACLRSEECSKSLPVSGLVAKLSGTCGPEAGRPCDASDVDKAWERLKASAAYVVLEDRPKLMSLVLSRSFPTYLEFFSAPARRVAEPKAADDACEAHACPARPSHEESDHEILDRVCEHDDGLYRLALRELKAAAQLCAPDAQSSPEEDEAEERAIGAVAAESRLAKGRSWGDALRSWLS